MEQSPIDLKFLQSLPVPPMDAMTEESVLDSSHYGCHFPIPLQRNPTSGLRKSMLIFDCNFPSAVLKERPELQRQMLQRAWAVLLWNYVRKDSISFAVILNDLVERDDQEPNATPVDAFEASVLHYEMFDGIRLTDICATGSYLSSLRDLTAKRINTAVDFSLSGLNDYKV